VRFRVISWIVCLDWEPYDPRKRTKLHEKTRNKSFVQSRQADGWTKKNADPIEGRRKGFLDHLSQGVALAPHAGCPRGDPASGL
jgi:hypothetical protein